MDYPSIMKRSKLLIHMTRWVNLTDILLCEILFKQDARK